MTVTLYSSGCPQCILLEKMLEKNNIDYAIESDEDVFAEHGFMSMPMLEVDGQMMNMKEAMMWIKNGFAKGGLVQ